MDLRLTPEQRRSARRRPRSARGLRPLLEADPEWRRQGMLSDGDSREVTRALGERGLDRDVVAGGARRARPHARSTRRSSRRCFGYHWLPLSLYLLSYKTIGARARAIRLAGAPRAAAARDRARRARLLPGLLRARSGQRPRVADDPRGASRRALRRRRPQDLDVERVARRLDLPRGPHRSGRAASTAGISVLVAPLDTPGIEVRRFPTLGGGHLCEVFLDGVEIPATNLVGELNGGWEVLMHTLDFERITAEKLGGLAWVLDGLEAQVPTALETPRPPARRARRRAAPLVPRRRPARPRRARERRLGDGEARGRPRRAAGRATRPSTCSASTGSRTETRPRPSRAASARSTARRSARRSRAERQKCSSS